MVKLQLQLGQQGIFLPSGYRILSQSRCTALTAGKLPPGYDCVALSRFRIFFPVHVTSGDVQVYLVIVHVVMLSTTAA